MKKTFTATLQVPGCSHAMFPGITECQDGSLLIHCQGASGFESPDARMFQFRSTDDGRSWQFEGILSDRKDFKFTGIFSETCKPAVLADGTVITSGYGFLRDRPDLTLSDYSRQFGRYPEMKNFNLRSTDNGKTWGNYEWIDHEYTGIENSGPSVRLNDGSVIFTGAPFELTAEINRGLVFKSDPAGKNFKEYSCFFADKNVTPFETRSAQLADGTIAIIFWAYDLKKNENLNNHIVISRDNAKTWSKAFDTGLAAQASNLCVYKNRLFAVQARRTGNDPGIFVNEIFISGETVSTGSDICLWSANGAKGKTGEINQLFESLKFGQPSVFVHKDEILLVFWSATSGNYRIEVYGYKADIL